MFEDSRDPYSLLIQFCLVILVLSVVQQVYQIRVNDEFILNGNAAIMKCLVPSFLQDFITIDSWEIDDEVVTVDMESIG